MSRAEFSIQARNTALRGETVHVDTRSTPARDGKDKGWSKVLGSFAAVYSDTPVRTERATPLSADSASSRLEAGVATYEEGKKIRETILGNLYKSFLSDDLATVASFSDHSTLLNGRITI